MSLTRIYPITLKLSTTPVVRPDENRKDVHNKPRAPRTTGPQSYSNNHFLFGCQQPNSTSKFYVWYFRTALQEEQMGYATTIDFLLLLSVTVTTAAIQHINREGVFACLNYGVIFRPQQTIRLVTEEWTDIFIMQLPECSDTRFETTYTRIQLL